MKAIKWSKRARQDIERIPDFMPAEIYTDIAAEIVSAARFIASTPKAGPMLGQGFDRKWPVKRFPYLLIYRPLPNEILISRVVHIRSDWTSLV